jgi:hypothetical protein
MKRIDISTKKYPNTYTFVDDEDFEELNKYKWHPNSMKTKGLYASRNEKNTCISMHRQIMNPGKQEKIDHINHNPLDNQKHNLRICTCQENNMNRSITSKNKSGYKGVSFCKRTKKWRGDIKKNGKSIPLGRYKTPEEAAHKYNKKAVEIFGEFAYLNIIPKVEVK